MKEYSQFFFSPAAHTHSRNATLIYYIYDERRWLYGNEQKTERRNIGSSSLKSFYKNDDFFLAFLLLQFFYTLFLFTFEWREFIMRRQVRKKIARGTYENKIYITRLTALLTTGQHELKKPNFEFSRTQHI